ncbi:hypothetical protein [Aurantimonas sp. HBX-1]|uniref:hypothetical protein n=1 Tax=Aurantimonas sp. HBX-1 TaxID=2906072 RepID=UPI001F357043|nr:hypothetical protein [Aurantimonas sp. HBX-1]UIJ71081.1 hypothetical protein LXB15_15315 [Aurantimonas sp. HBX-1]
MGISTKDVVENYRLVLGKEPAPNVIAYYVQAFDSVPALRRRLEFLAKRQMQLLAEWNAASQNRQISQG